MESDKFTKYIMIGIFTGIGSILISELWNRYKSKNNQEVIF